MTHSDDRFQELVETFNPFDPTLDRVPFELFSWIRHECPVAHLKSADAWLVAEHDDIVNISKDPDTFRSDGAARAPGVVVSDEEKLPFEIDPPRHRRIRRLLAGVVPSVKVRAAEPYIKGLCGKMIDDALARGTTDVVARIAGLLPTMVIAHMMGLPEDDVPDLVVWVYETVESGYVARNRTQKGEGLEAGLPEFMGYLSGQIEQRRLATEPRDDIISRLINSVEDGKSLTRMELLSAIFSLIIAGAVTTCDVLGGILYELARNPGSDG